MSLCVVVLGSNCTCIHACGLSLVSLDSSISSKISCSLQGHGDAVLGLDIGSEGSMLVTVCQDRVARWYDLKDLEDKSMGYRHKKLPYSPLDVAFGRSAEEFVVLGSGISGTHHVRILHHEAQRTRHVQDTPEIYPRVSCPHSCSYTCKAPRSAASSPAIRHSHAG